MLYCAFSGCECSIGSFLAFHQPVFRLMSALLGSKSGMIVDDLWIPIGNQDRQSGTVPVRPNSSDQRHPFDRQRANAIQTLFDWCRSRQDAQSIIGVRESSDAAYRAKPSCRLQLTRQECQDSSFYRPNPVSTTTSSWFHLESDLTSTIDHDPSFRYSRGHFDAKPDLKIGKKAWF